MKKTFLMLSFASLVTILTSHPVSAQIWDASYAGDQLAGGAPWNIAGTYIVNTGSITFGDGISSAFAEERPSSVGPQFAGSLWNPTGLAGTVELTFSIGTDAASGFSGGFAFYIGTQLYDVLFKANTVAVNGSSTAVVLPLATQTSLHASYDANGLDLYLNGVAVPSLQNVAGIGLTFSGLYIGKYEGAIGASGVVTYEEVRWNNSTAFAPVPEPSTVALAALGFGVVLFAGYRRGKIQG